MTRIVILGGPRTGKTTAAERIAGDLFGCGVDDFAVRHTDDLIEELKHLGKDAWSEGSRRVTEWLDALGPWIIEGVAMARALRKWREAHPGEPPPVDRVIRLTTPHVALTHQQNVMAKGEQTVWEEIGPWLFYSGVSVEHHGHDPGGDRHRVPHPRSACTFDRYGVHAVSCNVYLPYGECSCGQVRLICTRCMRPADGDCLKRTCSIPSAAHQVPRSSSDEAPP